MADIEKVIKGLEIQLDDLQKYADSDEILTLTQEQAKEIIALLKEQDNCENCAIAIEDRQIVVRCKDCRWYDEKISICDNCHLPRERTFFCADGKRKN